MLQTNKGLSVECHCFNTAGIVCSPPLFVPVACVMRLQCACASWHGFDRLIHTSRTTKSCHYGLEFFFSSERCQVDKWRDFFYMQKCIYRYFHTYVCVQHSKFTTLLGFHNNHDFYGQTRGLFIFCVQILYIKIYSFHWLFFIKEFSW